MAKDWPDINGCAACREKDARIKKIEDELTSAWMLGFHQRDDEVKVLHDRIRELEEKVRLDDELFRDMNKASEKMSNRIADLERVREAAEKADKMFFKTDLIDVGVVLALRAALRGEKEEG